jgi:hypothetical protein
MQAATSALAPAIPESPCPVCATPSARVLYQELGARSFKRTFVLCAACHCAFVPRSFHLATDVEKQRYDHHNNDSADVGYQAFLAQTARPVALYLGLRYLEAERATPNEASDDAMALPSLADLLRREDDDVTARGAANATASDAILARHFAAPRTKKAKAAAAPASTAPANAADAAVVAASASPADALEARVRNAVMRAHAERRSGAGGGGGVVGLDFGCGPGPTLDGMMRTALPFVARVALFDKFYFPDSSVFFSSPSGSAAGDQNIAHKATSAGGHTVADAPTGALPQRRSRSDGDGAVLESGEDGKESAGQGQQPPPPPARESDRVLYDFITATEVAEHIADAGAELLALWRHVRPGGGVLAVQTSRTEAHCAPAPATGAASAAAAATATAVAGVDPVEAEARAAGIDRDRFAAWHYLRDDTHVTFFHVDSFRHLRRAWNALPDAALHVRHMLVCGPSVVLLVKA